VDQDLLALGVDLGTGSARAFVLDGAGRRRGGVRYPYRWISRSDGGVEADADDVVELVFAALDAAVGSLWSGARVAAVGFSGLWHTLVGTDETGRAMTPVWGWGDTRAAGAAARLRSELDAAAVHARTGANLHPSYPPARLRWLRESEPETFRRVARWMSLPEYLWLRLTGDYGTDVSMAAGSGLLDQSDLEWDVEVLDACGVSRSQLGRIAARPSEVSVPGASVDAIARWPALRGAVWRMPVGDGACATIGSGCRDHSRIALSLGTSGALRVLVGGGWAPPPPGLWRYRLDGERTILGGAISNGGLVRRWLEELLELPARGAELDPLLAARAPGANGVVMLPFLAGERSPHWPLDATATFAGLRAGHDALDLLQAGLEGVAYRLVLLRRELRAAVPEAEEIVASGGALRASPAWARLLADALGEPLLLTTDHEASSRGAALLALEAAGLNGPAGLTEPPFVRIEPDPERHQAHAVAMERHLQVPGW
jgi:gluconokinase